MRNRLWRASWAALVVACGFIPTSLAAQRSLAAPNFGIQDSMPYWITAAEFELVAYGARLTFDPPECVFQDGVPRAGLRATLHLPHGAWLVSMRAYWRDDNPDENLTLRLRYPDWSVDAQGQHTTVESLDSSGDGWGSGFVNLGHTLDNFPTGSLGDGERSYHLQLLLPESLESRVSFCGVRILWRRQLSPAPQSATYDDVPTNHPHFRFIEALAESGVANSCSPHNFCPDHPVTRGQLAMYLARALGLYWPAP